MKVSARHFFKRYWRDYLWGILCLLITNILAASIPLRVKQIIDNLQHNQTQSASQLLGLIAVTVIVMFVIRIFSRYFLIGVGRRIEYDVRMNLYQHLLAMPRSYYDAHQTGELMSRLTNDLTALRMFLGGGIMLIANVIFAYVIVLPLMAMLSWRLTLLAFLLYPLVITLMRVLSSRVKRLSHAVQDRLGDLTAVAQENFSGISIIQAYAKEPEESARFYDAALGYYFTNLNLVKTRALLYILIAMVSGLSVLTVVGEGGREVITVGLGLSGFTAFLLYLERLSWPTVSFGWILSTFQQGIAALERINRTLEATPTITDAMADSSLKTIPTGPITVKNLSFQYENPYLPDSGVAAPLVLQNISFTVNPGEMVAIVGPIGSGKTTLLNLLVRLYNPPVNTLFIADISVEKFPLTVLREGITLMPQNSFLFSSTVQENIAYINPECHIDSVIETAQVAQIHEEILRFPQAYQTMVGERGVTLSGGQRQRTALARTLLVAPQILLLDDPFSNVDAETEEMIISALQQRHRQHEKTTIFSSQRFSLVRQADWILVLNTSGQIDAMGTHAELMETSELYRSLSKTTLDEN